MKRIQWLWLAPWLALAGCELPFPTDDDEDDDDEPDIVLPDDLCAPQDPSGTVVEETQANDPLPTPQGGEIRDGIYDLVRFDIYAPATADDNVRQRRFVVQGDTIVSISTDPGSAPQIVGGTFETDGTELKFSITCPQTGSDSMPYTATDDELWLFGDEPNVQVYARQ